MVVQDMALSEEEVMSDELGALDSEEEEFVP